MQYHLIVNDWLGRIAYYMRSPDGVRWKLDAGEAYRPGIVKHADGRVEDWYKFERIKVLQDTYGRAYQANFAVCDTVKKYDKGNDNHSSKNISIPLEVGKLAQIVGKDKIDTETKEIHLLLEAESNFNPHKDVDFKSLRFGAPEEVDFGRGSKVLTTQKIGKDILITFSGKGNGITNKNFVAKILGKSKRGTLLFAYAKLPWQNHNATILSSKFPEITEANGRKLAIQVEVENFGQQYSKPSLLKIEYATDNGWKKLATKQIPPLAPYQKTNVVMQANKIGKPEDKIKTRTIIITDQQIQETLEGSVIVR